MSGGITAIVHIRGGRVLVFGKDWHYGLLARWLHLISDDTALD